MDLALNNPQMLICHKTHQTKPNQAILNNMNLSQLSEKLLSVEKVIQFCLEKSYR